MLDIKRRKNSPHFQIVGVCPYTSERIRKSTKTSSKSEAKKILSAFLARRHNEAVYGPQTQTLFAESVIEYLAKGGEERFLDPLLNYFGTSKMVDITDQNLSAFCEKVYPGRKASTLVRQAYAPMQAIWNAAAKAEMVHGRTFTKPKIKRTVKKHADDAWLRAVLYALTTLRQRCVILFITYSGARASEVIRIKVKHFDTERDTILLAKTKNQDARLVPLPPLVANALKMLDLSKREALLFGYTQRFALNNMLKRACKRAGVEYLSPHEIGRHTFSARLLREGASLKALQEAGGWKSVQVVSQNYAHLERAQVDEQIRGARAVLDTNETQKLLGSSGDK